MAGSRSNAFLILRRAEDIGRRPLPSVTEGIRHVAGGFLACLLLVGASATAVKGQSLEWAKQSTSGGIHRAYGIATDTSGNSFVTGLLNDPATFGAGEPQETTVTGNIFVASFDPTGALRWARGATGGQASLGGTSIAADGAGTSYVTGSFRFALAFDDGTTLPASNDVGVPNMFLAKYDASGRLVWATNPDGGAFGWGVTVDGAGAAYVTGGFSGTITFGPGVALQAASDSIFIVKYDSAGTAVWAAQIGSENLVGDPSLAVDLDANVYLTAFVQGGSVIFSPGRPDETTLDDPGNRMVVARYGPEGTLTWARAVTGESAGIETANIAVDVLSGTDRGVHVAGTTAAPSSSTGAITFQPGRSDETRLTVPPFSVIPVVARFDIEGNLRWVRLVDDRSSFEGVAADAAGNSYVAGGGGHVYVAKYDREGALVWDRRTAHVGGSGGLATGISLDAVANIFTTGSFTGDVIFGAGEPNETLLSVELSGSSFGVFVAKYLTDRVEDNHPPVANDQVVTTPEDTSVELTLTGSDPDQDPLAYSIVLPPTHGVLTGSLPDLVYTPDPDFNGSDEFTFRVSDGELNDDAIVSISVTAVNDAPVAEDQGIVTPQNVPVSIELQATDVDGDPLSYDVGTSLHGRLAVNGRDVTYTPDADYTGPDSFTFRAFDGTVFSAPATVTITVGPGELIATAVSAVSGSGPVGGTGTLKATLKAGTTALGGRTVTFTLFGSPVGTATTNKKGVASLKVSLVDITAGTYANVVAASFAGDSRYASSSAQGHLAVKGKK